MSKHLLKDMIPIERHKKEIPKKFEIKEDREKWENEIDHPKKKSRYLLWLVAFISAVFCFFAISFLFSKAEVFINPKTKDVTLNEKLSATKDSNTNGLSFDLVTIPGEESKTIEATGEKDVALKATGTVVIFNSFGSSSQALSTDTRLEGSNGKIYKTVAKTVVPGMGKNGITGQAEVGIYAAEAGADYNSAPLDFNILGFKGTSKYSKFVVRSKTGTEITGGFKGKAPDISDTDKATALLDLKTALEAKLLQKATDHPIGTILFKDAVFFNIDDLNVSSTYNTDNSLTLTEKGTLYGILFNEKELTKKIAEDNVDKYDGSDVYLSNINDLIFSLPAQESLSNKDSVSFDNVQNINFNLSGPAKIVWRLDGDKFMADLLGRSKSDFKKILLQYPNIDSATLTLNPIWKMSIPDKIQNIKVTVNYPK